MDTNTEVAVSERTISAQVAEHVLATGDISKLTPRQRVEYVLKICDAMGLNALTRPIRFLSLNGQIQPYFTRDGTDQLRKLHNISLHVVEQKTEAGVFTTRVVARMPSGREDEDIGAVTLPQSGESRANALMKCLTKAKRRVTLSICGLGFISEDELDTVPGAHTFDAEEELPTPAPQSAQRPAYVAGEPPAPSPQRSEAQWRSWLEKLREALAGLNADAVAELSERHTIKNAIKLGPPWVGSEATALITEAYSAAAKAADEAEGEIPFDDAPKIEGEEKLAAG